jgi:hypothetical protein
MPQSGHALARATSFVGEQQSWSLKAINPSSLRLFDERSLIPLDSVIIAPKLEISRGV